MAGVSELRTCNGKDKRVHVRLSPTRKTYCRQDTVVKDLQHWRLENWECEDATNEEFHCQACRTRALAELEKHRQQEASKTMAETTTYKWHPFANLYPMMPDEEIDALADSIERIGQQEPVRLTQDGLVVDGRNRLVACRKRNIEPKVETLPELDDLELLHRVRAWNEDRRQLTPAQRAAAAAKADDLLKELRAKAEQRRLEGNARGGQSKGSVKSSDPDPETSKPVESRDELGKMFGVSGRSVDRARRVREASPEQFEAIERGKSIAAAERDAGLKPAKTSKPKPKPKQPAEIPAKATQADAVRDFETWVDGWRSRLDGDQFAGLLAKIKRTVNAMTDTSVSKEELTDLTFPCSGTGPDSWTLPKAKFAEYVESYPGLDIRTEMVRARQWVRDNPTRRKTAKGMTKFLNGWLDRSQNRGGGNGGPNTRQTVEERQLGEWEKAFGDREECAA